ncbi:hypothetical protein I4U23_020648 [Adineta vaga]|nr:hypothetical protein I4U23_020648 [Adineta vaga]
MTNYLHVILNSFLLIFSIGMLTAVKSYKPYRALFYFVFKIACFINTITIFVESIVHPNNNNYNSIKIFYNVYGPDHPSMPTIMIFCLGLFECLWKIFSLLMIFRSIQYLRDYCLHKELNSLKHFEYQYQSSNQLVIRMIPIDSIDNKQYIV